MAAVLGGGDRAVLSHRSAAALWCLRPTGRTRIEVTVPRWRRKRAGVQVHVARLPGDEVTVVRGIPVTTVSRTLLDLASVLNRRQMERACNEAEVRELAGRLSVSDLIEDIRAVLAFRC
jgi:predicted transcriptional regulator of viral defense system